ncbi:MAG: creatininase family protein [Patescibacteria group bacterium]
MNKKLKNIFILPIGSYEYHGANLPPDTDSIIANRIAVDFVDKIKKKISNRIILLPSLNFGLSYEHSGLPQTIYISHITFYNFVSELLHSIADKNSILLIINAHGGNTHTLSAIEADFNYTHNNCKTIVFSLYPIEIKKMCSELFGEFDVHAGSVEASLIAFYQNKTKHKYSRLESKKISGSLRFFKTKDFYPDGIIKELPIVIADPQKGKILHDAILNNLYDFSNELLPKITKFLSK